MDDTLLLAAAAAGLVAGAWHALAGADHAAAIAPLALSRPEQALCSGTLWGIGHGLGALLAAAAGIALQAGLGLAQASSLAERLVGPALLLLGVHTLCQLLGRQPAKRPAGPALALGALHGVSGAAHLVAVLPALALGPLATAAYLGGFVGGAALCMTGLAHCLGTFLQRRPELARASVAASGLAACAVGAAWIAA